jgi:hypothetical protein
VQFNDGDPHVPTLDIQARFAPASTTSDPGSARRLAATTV